MVKGLTGDSNPIWLRVAGDHLLWVSLLGRACIAATVAKRLPLTQRKGELGNTVLQCPTQPLPFNNRPLLSQPLAAIAVSLVGGDRLGGVPLQFEPADDGLQGAVGAAPA